ncbi:MAG: hypothetical protein WD055_05085 [Candidatus Dependentiae bacterium]
MKKYVLILISLMLLSPYSHASDHSPNERKRYPHGTMIPGVGFAFDVDIQALEKCWTGYKQFPNFYKPPKDLLPEENDVCLIAKISDSSERKKELEQIALKAKEEQWDASLREFINKKLNEKGFISTIKSHLRKRPKANSF